MVPTRRINKRTKIVIKTIPNREEWRIKVSNELEEYFSGPPKKVSDNKCISPITVPPRDPDPELLKMSSSSRTTIIHVHKPSRDSQKMTLDLGNEVTQEEGRTSREASPTYSLIDFNSLGKLRVTKQKVRGLDVLRDVRASYASSPQSIISESQHILDKGREEMENKSMKEVSPKKLQIAAKTREFLKFEIDDDCMGIQEENYAEKNNISTNNSFNKKYPPQTQ